MGQLSVDITRRLRSYELALTFVVDRETVALAGPSGAGKSTALRAIAGLVRPDRGRIALGDDVFFDRARGIDLPPEARRVGLVFQEYALFPHMTVRKNVGYGGAERVDELLARFRIAHLADERPAALSGGERQRVALARALARDPGLLLLDEPLAALDSHTRAHVRAELQDLLSGAGLPVLLVTHDFEDAAALADHVGVIVDGRLRQVGTARDLVDAPADGFVASFTGSNLLEGDAERVPGGSRIIVGSGAVIRCPTPASGQVRIAIHPWRINVLAVEPGGDWNAIPGRIASVTPRGNTQRVRVGSLVAELPADGEVPPRGSKGYAVFAPADVRIVMG
jgi:ABC-type sulfate/molybdate transport systems ATPase subunit